MKTVNDMKNVLERYKIKEKNLKVTIKESKKNGAPSTMV